MAKTEIVRGIKCKKCGHIDVPPFKHHLCQNCGAQVVEGFKYGNGGWTITNNANIIPLKITHKLFKNILEEVNTNG